MKRFYFILLLLFAFTKGNTQAIVDPLVHTKWNQDPPYNELCPYNTVLSKRTLTGCVATAMAQIMAYWKYPSLGIGSHSYIGVKPESIFYGVQSANFGNTTYNWSNMPDVISTSNIDIATLMYHCGVSVNMDYGITVSSTPSGLERVRNALINYFGYNSSTMRVISKSDFSDEAWITELRNELNAGHPILYGSSSREGHVWIIDGYYYTTSANDWFHINWGLKTFENGYYALSTLSNVGGYDFSQDQEAVIGIQPPSNLPDMVINDQSVTNNNPVAGNTITVYCREGNYGGAYAGANNVKFVLSSYSDYFSAPDKQILGTIPVSGLAAYFKSGTLSASVTIPANKPPGTYYLYFVADGDNNINEDHENNNAVPAILNVSASSCSPPTNDNPGNGGAITLTENANAISGSSCGATNSGFPTCTNLNPDDDVFYKFVAITSNVTVNVSPASGSDYNPAFQLLSGSDLYNLQAVSPGCINNAGAGQTETQTYTLNTGNTYYVRIWHAGSGWGTSGNFLVSVSGSSCSSPGPAYGLSPGTATSPGTTISTTTPQLSWSAPAGASTYQVNISKYPYGYYNIVYTSSNISATSITVPAGALQNGTNYRWDVTTYPSGSCSPSISNDVYFNVNTGTACAAPTTQASNINFSGVQTNSVTVSWTAGNGSRRVVKINKANNFNTIANGTITNPNSVYAGSGEQIVYDGSNNYVTVSGLNANTTYYFKVYEANCTGTMGVYNNNAATNNPNVVTTATSNTPTCTVPTTQASNVVVNASTNSITLNWTNGNGSKRIVKMNTFNGFTTPVNGTDPSYSNYWNNAGEQVIYSGSGNTITVTGLSPSTEYCFKVFEANCSGSDIVYAANISSNEACGFTRQTCTSPTDIPTPTTGYTQCQSTYPYALTYNASGYSLYWQTNCSSCTYDIEVYEYPFNAANLVYSRQCISNNMATVPASYLQQGKKYRWRIRMNSFVDCSCKGNWSEFFYFEIVSKINELTQNLTVCNGQGITLTTPVINVPGSASVQYLWYKRTYINNQETNILLGTGTSFYVDTAHSGYIFVKLVYSGSTICPGNDTTAQSLGGTVTVSTTPAAPVISPNTNVSVCEGNSLTLTAAPPDLNDTYWYGYHWEGPKNFSSSNKSIFISTVNSANAGDYTCNLIGYGGCPGVVATASVVVNPAPVASYTYTASGNTVTFTNTSTNAPTYSWNFGDGQTSTQQNPSHTFSANGTYQVCLNANGTTGCNPGTYCQSISIGTSQQVKTRPTFVKLFQDNNGIYNWNPTDFVQATSDSSFICVGTYYDPLVDNGNGGHVIRFFKIDKGGNTVWVREFPRSPYLYQYWPIIVQSQNGYLMAFTYGFGNDYANVMEIDEQGNTLWSKKIQNTGQIISMIKVNDGYVCRGGASNGFDMFKIDFSGNLVWKRKWNYNVYKYSSGNNSTEVFVRDLRQDGNGNLYMAGYYYNNASYNTTQGGIIIKLDANGNHIWTKALPNSSAEDHNDITSTIVDNNNDILIVVNSWDNSINSSTYLLGKINSSGNIITVKQVLAGDVRLINSTSNNTYNCLLKNDSFTLSGFANLSTGLDMFNNQKGLNVGPYSRIFKSTLDGRFAGVSQYPVTISNNDYRYQFEKFGFSDVSCRDADMPAITLTPATITLTSLTPTEGTCTVTTSSLSINSNIISINDSNVCDTKPLIVSGKVFLQGAYNTATSGMNNTLNASGILSANAITQPYATGTNFNYSGTEHIPAGFFNINTHIVDWVLVDLIDANQPSNIIATRAAFVRQDGTLIETDGSTGIKFLGVMPKQYYVSIRHRNHLGIRSLSTVDFSSGSGSYDFTSSANKSYQNQTYTSTVSIGGIWAMRSGDANSNGTVKYNGPANDQSQILNSKLGGSLSNILNNVYSPEDINMDGKVRWNGPANEQNFLLNSILQGSLTNIFMEQL